MRGALAEVRRCSYEAAFILFDGPKEFRLTISGARQCRPCRLFAPRKALWCAHRRISLAPEGNDAPTTARKRGLQHYVFSPTSVPEGFQRASGKPFGAPAGAYPLSRVGIDAPTTARVGTCRPIGTFICFDRRTRRGAGGERKAPCKQRWEPTLPEKIFFLGE